ncbi:hypothetical protein E2562_020829 [Oryza meyeriana var. granulata]|uniref:Uncharacterized protein n=1 Tax=Oryza meyeriana var. granulata TaxID=110450 RepID=A0A6G1CHV9_9ORYZ|nr:hypothetical protein E2562_020829 [Oryza meyeriana var. granulata]
MSPITDGQRYRVRYNNTGEDHNVVFICIYIFHCHRNPSVALEEEPGSITISVREKEAARRGHEDETAH